MPTVFEILGLRGYFFSGDHLPVHLHVVKENASAKIQVEPEIKVMSNSGLKPKEISTALDLVEKYHDEIYGNVERILQMNYGKNSQCVVHTGQNLHPHRR